MGHLIVFTPLKCSGLTCSEHEKTLLLLNTHGDVLGSRYKTGSKLFESLFNKFIQALKQSEFNESDLEVKSTDLARAYSAFMDCLKNEVKESKPSWRQ